jgi:hypothetical protein
MGWESLYSDEGTYTVVYVLCGLMISNLFFKIKIGTPQLELSQFPIAFLIGSGYVRLHSILTLLSNESKTTYFLYQHATNEPKER